MSINCPDKFGFCSSGPGGVWCVLNLMYIMKPGRFQTLVLVLIRLCYPLQYPCCI